MSVFFVVAFWETRRIFKNRTAVAAGIVAPLIIALMAHFGVEEGLLRLLYAACWISAVSLFFAAVRFVGDRVSGFAQGLYSSPVNKFAVAAGRAASWVVFAVLQVGLYVVFVRILG